MAISSCGRLVVSVGYRSINYRYMWLVVYRSMDYIRSKLSNISMAICTMVKRSNYLRFSWFFYMVMHPMHAKFNGYIGYVPRWTIRRAMRDPTLDRPREWLKKSRDVYSDGMSFIVFQEDAGMSMWDAFFITNMMFGCLEMPRLPFNPLFLLLNPEKN